MVKRIALIFLMVSAGASGWADEITVPWNGPDGVTYLSTTVTLRGEVTRTHVESLSFSVSIPDSASINGAAPSNGLTKLTPSMEGLPALPVAQRARSGEGSVQAPPDWSGGKVHIEPLVSNCSLVLGSASGLLGPAESAVFTATGAMTIVAAMIPLKGDPDLYLVDVFGNTICASTHPGKTAESCEAIEQSCQNGSLFIEVFGLKKKNTFSLGVWLTSAI